MGFDLTKRETECVGLAGRGLTDDEIAYQLGISRKTVGSHLQNAYGKLGVRDRRRAAQKLGIESLGNAIPISPGPEPRPSAAAEARAEQGADDREHRTTAWFRLPPVPDDRFARIGLIVMFAVIGVLFSMGIAATLAASLELTQRAAPVGAR